MTQTDKNICELLTAWHLSDFTGCEVHNLVFYLWCLTAVLAIIGFTPEIFYFFKKLRRTQSASAPTKPEELDIHDYDQTSNTPLQIESRDVSLNQKTDGKILIGEANFLYDSSENIIDKLNYSGISSIIVEQNTEYMIKQYAPITIKLGFSKENQGPFIIAINTSSSLTGSNYKVISNQNRLVSILVSRGSLVSLKDHELNIKFYKAC